MIRNKKGKLYGGTMDRRQRKTREAIFSAFTLLLSKKEFDKITVGEIIEKADVGRATFYAHFETKDFLLKELCEELFCHIFDSLGDTPVPHRHIFNCDEHDSVYLHLFRHLYKNDNHILDLLSSRNNEVFLRYFRENLNKLTQTQLPLFSKRKDEKLPLDFWANHVSYTFIETVRWWVDNGLIESPEIIAEYFFLAV